MLADLREFLRGSDTADFRSGDDFAEKVVERMEQTAGRAWADARAVRAVNQTTRGIYEYYRLRDATPFGDNAPIRLRLGGPDTKSIKFFGELDHFYFSKFADNTSEPLKTFFREAYFENGAALFGRETEGELDDFRRAAGDKLKNLSDRSIKTIAQTSVQRVRNWAHVGSLSQAEIKFARYAATLDARTTPICRAIDGKIIRIGSAQSAIERLSEVEPGEFAKETYESPIGKALAKEPVHTINAFLEDDGKTISDTLTNTSLSIPPLHPNCRTRLEGIVAGAENE